MRWAGTGDMQVTGECDGSKFWTPNPKPRGYDESWCIYIYIYWYIWWKAFGVLGSLFLKHTLIWPWKCWKVKGWITGPYQRQKRRDVFKRSESQQWIHDSLLCSWCNASFHLCDLLTYADAGAFEVMFNGALEDALLLTEVWRNGTTEKTTFLGYHLKLVVGQKPRETLYTPCWNQILHVKRSAHLMLFSLFRSLETSIHVSHRPGFCGVVVENGPTEDISVPHLVSVGDLTVIDNDRLLVARFPRLRAVAGGVQVSYNNRLRSFISPGTWELGEGLGPTGNSSWMKGSLESASTPHICNFQIWMCNKIIAEAYELTTQRWKS